MKTDGLIKLAKYGKYVLNVDWCGGIASLQNVTFTESPAVTFHRDYTRM